jgi:para-nitrobenzyl esterase
MHKHLIILFAFFCLFGCVSNKQTDTDSLQFVKTEAGLISGTFSNGVYAFKGVPFAAPPVGDLRWRKPQPSKPWTDTLSCKTFRASPMQNEPKAFRMWTEEFQPPKEPISEDCLYLNVWTAAKSEEEKLPVMIWIPGGGFINGSGSCPIYDGEAMAKEGIVYVSINYRLNIFGFMAHPELTAEADHRSLGNYGIMDQIAAIQWVKNNIKSFGGDPERITIAGQSAGSAGVQAVVSSPLSKGMFQGAIAQSGTMTGRRVRSLQEAEQIGIALSDKFPSPKIETMRGLSADSLLSLGNTMPFLTFTPIIDGYVIPDDVKRIFEKQQHNDVPLMGGWVTGDASLSTFKPMQEFKTIATQTYGSRANEFFTLFPATTEEVSNASQHKLALVQALAYPYREWAASNKTNSYIYQFTHVPVDKPGFPNYGAFHSAEIPFALHTLKHWDRPWREEDYAVEKYMTAYWLNFVKTGNPNGSGLPEWKPFTKSNGNIMELGKEAVLTPGLFKEELQFLGSHMKQQLN